jgi:hypothetical protein
MAGVRRTTPVEDSDDDDAVRSGPQRPTGNPAGDDNQPRNESGRSVRLNKKQKLSALFETSDEEPQKSRRHEGEGEGGEEEGEEGAEGAEEEERHTDDDDVPSGPSSHGDDESDFVQRWETFLDKVKGRPDSREWKDLYGQARKLWKAGGPEEHPNEDDDDALQEFENRINRPLEPIVGRV